MNNSLSVWCDSGDSSLMCVVARCGIYRWTVYQEHALFAGVCAVWDISGAHIHLSNTISDRARWSSHQAINHIHPDTSKHTCNNAHLTCAAHIRIYIGNGFSQTSAVTTYIFPQFQRRPRVARGAFWWWCAPLTMNLYMDFIYIYYIYVSEGEMSFILCVPNDLRLAQRHIIYSACVCTCIYVPLEWYPSTACNKWGEWVIAGHRWEAFV